MDFLIFFCKFTMLILYFQGKYRITWMPYHGLQRNRKSRVGRERAIEISNPIGIFVCAYHGLQRNRKSRVGRGKGLEKCSEELEQFLPKN